MRYRPIHALAMATFVVVTMTLLIPTLCTSCEGSGGAGAQARQNDSLFWADSAYKLNMKANTFYNNNDIDSLEAFVPRAMKVCREHNQWERYYIIWRVLVERYIWNDEYDKAMAAAMEMQDDAIRRGIEHGLFEACSLLGIGYAYRGNNLESIRYFRKAIEMFNSSNVAPLMEAYNYLSQVLADEDFYQSLGPTLDEWREQIDRNHYSRTSVKLAKWASWNYQHRCMLADYLAHEGKFDEASAVLDSAGYYMKIEGSPAMDVASLLEARCGLALKMHDFESALQYSQQAYDVSKGIDNSHLTNAMTARVLALEGLQRYKDALEWQHRLNAFKDSLSSGKNMEQLNALNKRYEMIELRMQAEREHMEAVSVRFYMFMVIVLLVVVGGLFFARYRIRSDRRMAKIKADQERIEGELQIAHDIQMSMVSSHFPDYPGLDMYAYMNPAREVGGDLYNYVLKGDMLYFCVGDVSGKGVPASLFMAQAARLFHAMASGSFQPVNICDIMNIEMSGEDNINGMFVSLFVGLLDLKTGHLTFCNAGHNPPVLGGGEHGGDFLKMEPNAPIGLWPELRYKQEEIESIKGRPLFIYTDGLNEAENARQEQFGEDRLLNFLRNCKFKSSRQVIESITADVERHREGTEPNDDLTMMCLHIEA